MINIPKPPEDFLINEIMEDVEFFSQSQMLFFERSQIFQSDIIPTHTSAINLDNPGKYNSLHPQYDPANLAPQNIVRYGQVANPHEIDFKALKAAPNTVFFVCSGNQYDIWIIGLPTTYLIYHTNNHKGQLVPLSCEAESKNGVVNFNQGDKRLMSFNLKVNEESSVKQGVKEACALFNKGISNQKFKTFELFFKSILINGGFPPINYSLISLYRSIVENIQFLYLFSITRFNITKIDEALISAWLEAAGHNIITLIPLMIFSHLEVTHDPNNIFKQELFLTILYTKIIEKDSGFLQFLNNFNIQADDLADEFLTSFENVEFQPLSQFILHHLYKGCLLKFPGTNSHYFTISSALFLRVMMPHLNAKHPNLTSRFTTLVPLFNMNEGKIGLEKVKRFKDLLEQFEHFPHSFGMIMSPETCENSINLLINVVQEEPVKFYKTATQINIVKITNLFYKSIYGTNPSDINIEQSLPLRLIRRTQEEYTDLDEYSDLMSYNKEIDSENS